MKKIWQKFKNFFLWLLSQLKDKKNIVIFIIVFIVLSSEVWVPYLLAIITGNKWWWGIGSACWAFWLGPFTPFIPICIAVTVGVRKVLDSIQKHKKEKKYAQSVQDITTGQEKDLKTGDAQTEQNIRDETEKGEQMPDIYNDKE